jgi:hypothetical protein
MAMAKQHGADGEDAPDGEVDPELINLATSFPPGATVVAHGLVSAAELNKQQGVVVAYNMENGRVIVEFPGGRGVQLKPENLTLLPT